MAHKGKKYKLQFRRDLTLNRIQTRGAGEAYNLLIDIAVDDPPIHVLQYVLLGKNLDRSANPTRVWESNFELVGAHFWKFRSTLVNAWQYPNCQQIWEIEDAIAGVIFRHAPVNGLADSDYGGWGFRSGKPWDFTKPPFPSKAIEVTCNTNLLGYDRYNP